MVRLLLQQGLIAYQASDLTKAASLFQTVLKMEPENFDALHFLGLLAADCGHHDDAVQLMRRALSVNPHVAAVHANLASSLRRLGRYSEALASLDQALALDPRSAEALNTQGNILRVLGRLDKALASLDQAIRLQPQFFEAHDNRGNVLRDMGHLDEALASYREARRIAPDYASAAWNESLCRLLMGDFARGWPLYEAGWKAGLRAPWVKCAQPLWTGPEPLQGRTILLHAEQGMGDTIQFSRYAQVLASHGARVILEVPPALKSLLQGLQNTAQVIATGERRPTFDCHAPLLGLPLACQTRLDTIPPPPRLMLDKTLEERWQDRVGPKKKPCIGIAWSGNPALENDHNRSIPLKTLSAILNHSVQFFSLQRDLRPEDENVLQQFPVLQHFGHALHDFSDTAALIAQMDLVISVDTAVAHLAASLGKPTWILLPYIPDWRWLLDRKDSPWYPTVRLFRQTEARSWPGLLEHQIQPHLASFLHQ